jgi:hypothetical protein
MRNAAEHVRTAEAVQPIVAPRPRPARRTHQPARPQPSPAPAPLALAPRTADLVEREDTGEFHLRTYVDGRYLWQLVAGPGTAIPDTGRWVSRGQFYHTYWYNHGTYRRRAGHYHPIDGALSAARAAQARSPSR